MTKGEIGWEGKEIETSIISIPQLATARIRGLDASDRLKTGKRTLKEKNEKRSLYMNFQVHRDPSVPGTRFVVDESATKKADGYGYS